VGKPGEAPLIALEQVAPFSSAAERPRWPLQVACPQLTCAFWLRLTEEQGTPTGFAQPIYAICAADVGGGVGDFLIGYVEDGLSLLVEGNTGAVYDDCFRGWLRFSKNLATGEWHHVAVVYDASARTAELFVMGVREEVHGFHLAWPVRLTTVSVGEQREDCAGAEVAMERRFPEDQLKQVRVYNRALSKAEIAEVIRETRVTPLAPPEEIPLVGMGTAGMPSLVKSGVAAGLRAGLRHLDCSPAYGTERVVGAALQEAIAEGVVRREDVWITSGLWCTCWREVELSVAASLEDLQTDYIDLYLIQCNHSFKAPKGSVVGRVDPTRPFRVDDDGNPVPRPVPLLEVWRALERVQHKGLVRHIGVSNFGEASLRTLLKHAVTPLYCNQVERHPYLPNRSLVNFCKDRGIQIVASAPLGAPHKKDVYGVCDELPLTSHPTVVATAQAHNTTAARVILAWNIASSVAVIPTADDPIMVEDVASSMPSLSLQELAALDGLECGLRTTGGEGHPSNKRPWLRYD